MSLVAMAAFASAAQADSVGLAQSRVPFQIERTSGAPPSTGGNDSVVNEGDRLVAGEEPVLIRTPNGNTILVGRNSSVRFSSANALEFESGDLAVASVGDSELDVAYKDLHFVPLASGSQEKAPSQMALRAESGGQLQVLSLRRTVAAVQNAAPPVQVAVLGDTDVVRFLQTGTGRWVPIEIADAGTGTGDVVTDGAGGAGGEPEKGCYCVSQLKLTDLADDLAAASTLDGQVSFAQDKGTQATLPPNIPLTFTVAISSAQVECGDKIAVPVNVYQAPNLNAFKITLAYNDLCATVVEVNPGASTPGWEVSWVSPRDGIVVITGVKGEEGLPVEGLSEILQIVIKQASRCPCESPLTLTALREGLSGAQVVDGNAICRNKSDSAEPTPPPPPIPAGFSVQVGSNLARCQETIEIPLTVAGAPVDIQEFKMTLLYNDACLDYKSIKDGEGTPRWDIDADKTGMGTLEIAGKPGNDGKPVVGQGEIAIVKFRCARPFILIPWWWVGGAAAGAGLAGTGISVWYDRTNDGDHWVGEREPSSPTGP